MKPNLEEKWNFLISSKTYSQATPNHFVTRRKDASSGFSSFNFFLQKIMNVHVSE